MANPLEDKTPLPEKPTQFQASGAGAGVFEVTPSATPAFDFANGTHQHLSVTSAIAPTFANIKDGSVYVLHLTQDGIGGHTVTWPIEAKFGLVDGKLSVAANASDLFLCFARGGSLYMVPAKTFL